ncbi:hypothetical protein HYH02_007790 [Chlamydomonas schloesseri]|uniref:Peptidase C1A papain C-terminal domain-containing protein n=1 Tax=Chlamydomonas schloesseri TaxID=2026947 RepID=A0A836B4H7_9CHLO|nr:hypothetical protein HYH02_007790 [Chlamydomonas schloesseri]|eukprot:KAG2447039.1 hypothetical protein HYH02_007790 [Chlamydomonas schloesseri]
MRARVTLAAVVLLAVLLAGSLHSADAQRTNKSPGPKTPVKKPGQKPSSKPSPKPSPAPSSDTPGSIANLNIIGRINGVALESLQANFRVPLSDMYNWLIIGNTQALARQQALQLKTDLASAVLVSKMFDQFATAYGKVYTPSQATLARQAFAANLKTIADINLNPASTFTASCNAYCDLDFASFQKQQLMDVSSLGDMPKGADDLPGADGVGPGDGGPAGGGGGRRALLQSWPPASVDWRAAGKLTPIRNQGGCGSCWAFAATAALEANYLIRFGSGPACDALDLSEQQIVSCANANEGYGGSKGCSGGWSTDALDYVYKRKQMTERRWPYTSSTGTCNRGMPGPGERIATGRTYYLSTAASEDRLKRWVAIGPTVIYFCVEDSFRWYTGGYYSSSTCGTCHNHAMVAVGYTATGANPHWIIRNSWGTGWGGWEFGYARVRMQGSTAGPCGLHQTAIAPTFQITETLASRCPPPPPSPPAPCKGFFCNIFDPNTEVKIDDSKITQFFRPSPPLPPPPCNTLLCKGLSDVVKTPISIGGGIGGLIGRHRRLGATDQATATATAAGAATAEQQQQDEEEMEVLELAEEQQEQEEMEQVEEEQEERGGDEARELIATGGLPEVDQQQQVAAAEEAAAATAATAAATAAAAAAAAATIVQQQQQQQQLSHHQAV